MVNTLFLLLRVLYCFKRRFLQEKKWENTPPYINLLTILLVGIGVDRISTPLLHVFKTLKDVGQQFKGWWCVAIVQRFRRQDVWVRVVYSVGNGLNWTKHITQVCQITTLHSLLKCTFKFILWITALKNARKCLKWQPVILQLRRAIWSIGKRAMHLSSGNEKTRKASYVFKSR